MPAAQSSPPPPDKPDAQRADAAQRATWVSVWINLLLTGAQMLVGWLAHSQSLVAHALHSLSDLLSDFLVLWASHQGAQPADGQHPYGHARIETAATLLLGVSLVAVGGGIMWQSGQQLASGIGAEPVGWLAFWIAVLTVVAKEGLYRYLIGVARRLHSPLLTANALHSRADAASALVVVVGIGGALLGWAFLDALAAVLMGFMILKMGAELALEALRELIDTGLDENRVAAIRATLLASHGVRGVHDLRTRRMAHQVLVDVHVQVDPRISVSEGHQIAEAARAAILAAHEDILDVLVHIDPEIGNEADQAASRLPSRDVLRPRLERLFADLPRPERMILHYLDGQIEIDLYFTASHLNDGVPPQEIERRFSERARAEPLIRALRLNFVLIGPAPLHPPPAGSA